MTNREDLELQARMTCSAEVYYDLMDGIDDVTDAQLRHIIECQGDYRKEMEKVV